MNTDDNNNADERWLDLHLEEELGNVHAPDLRDRVVQEFALQAGDGTTHGSGRGTPVRSLRSIWIAAAALVLGVTTVVAVLQHQADADRRETVDPHGAQDPKPTKPNQIETELLPKSLKEFQKHAATATSISIASGQVLPIAMRDIADKLRVTICDEATVTLVRTELQKLTRQQPAGWKWSNNIRIHLADGRYINCAMYAPDKHTLGIRGLGDFKMSTKLRDFFGPRVVEIEIRTSLAAGNAKSREDLLREGDVAIPRDVERLTCSGLNDDDLELLSRFQDLETVVLSRCSETITGSGLHHLLRLPNLRVLKLRYSKVDDESLALLGSHPTLRELDVSSHERLTGAGMRSFVIAGSLESLKIGWGNTLTDDGLAAIASVSSLRTLDVSGRRLGKLTLAGFTHLGTMPQLQELSLENLPIPMDEALATLGAAPRLTNLNISATDCTNIGLAAMQARHNADHGRTHPLRQLDASICKQLGGPGVCRVIAGFVDLQHLVLRRWLFKTSDGAGALSSDEFEEIEVLLKLHTLELNAARLDAPAWKHIARLPSLTTLDLSFNGEGIDNDALANLASAPKLEHLKLTGCDNFDDAGLKHLESLANLLHLDLNTCDGFTAAGLASFRKAKPNCELRLPDQFR